LQTLIRLILVAYIKRLVASLHSRLQGYNPQISCQVSGTPGCRPLTSRENAVLRLCHRAHSALQPCLHVSIIPYFLFYMQAFVNTAAAAPC
jgi:hypothetical protein